MEFEASCANDPDLLYYLFIAKYLINKTQNIKILCQPINIHNFFDD